MGGFAGSETLTRPQNNFAEVPSKRKSPRSIHARARQHAAIGNAREPRRGPRASPKSSCCDPFGQASIPPEAGSPRAPETDDSEDNPLLPTRRESSPILDMTSLGAPTQAQQVVPANYSATDTM